MEPELKQELYVALVHREQTMKDWFIGQATNFLKAGHKSAPSKEVNLSNQALQGAHGIPSSANRKKK